MLPYDLLIMLPLAASILYKKSREKNLLKIKNYCLPLFFAIFIVLLSLRSTSCGADLKTYSYFFNQAKELSFKRLFDTYPIETAYFVLNKLSAMCCDSFQVFLMIAAVLSVGPIFLFYKKETKVPFLTVIMFATVAPFAVYFSALRQAIAMAFVVPAWYCAKNRKLVKFVLIVFVASLFHQSAFILLILYPIYRLKIPSKALVIILPAVILFYFYKETMFIWLLKFVGHRYLERYGIIKETGASNVFLLLLAFSALSFALPDESKMSQDDFALRNLLLISTMLQMFASLNDWAMRFNYYFLLFVPVTITKIISLAPPKNRKISAVVEFTISVFLVFIFFWKGYTRYDNILRIYPYIPFWR